jgi:cytochrome c oxidase subunit 1
VLIGGLINGVFGGLFYWFPKVTGRMMNEKLGKVFFWLFFVGMNVTFMPMHWTGLLACRGAYSRTRTSSASTI